MSHLCGIMRHTFITFTEAEMLAYWRLHLNLDPSRHGSDITRADGIDLDAQLTQRIRQWYATLLATSPVESLPQADITAQLAVRVNSDRSVEIPFPANLISPVAVKLRSWAVPVTEFVTPDTPTALQQRSAYLRGGSVAPVAVMYPDRLVLYSAASATDRVESFIAAVRPPAGTYIVDEAMLASIPDRLR